MATTTAELAYALLALFEGEKLEAYADPGGIWTIGIGHTGPVDGVAIHEGMTITSGKSWDLFLKDTGPLLDMVKHLPPASGAAHASFGYNCGKHALENVLAGRDSISEPIHTQDAHGHVRDWLVKRRRIEALLASL